MTCEQCEHVHKQELGSRTWYTLSTNDNTEDQFTLPLVSIVVADWVILGPGCCTATSHKRALMTKEELTAEGADHTTD
jgi:hypothetical protein